MRGLILFCIGNCLKGNEIVRVEFELAYCDVAVQQVNHCATDIPAGKGIKTKQLTVVSKSI